MSTKTAIATDTYTLQGTIGSPVNLNAPYVNFNLTVNPEDHKVHGTVKIYPNPPSEKPYTGNVTGTAYATGYGSSVQIMALYGTIPSNNPLTPINFPFNASIDLEADGQGRGGFNFKGKHIENVPVETKS